MSYLPDSGIARCKTAWQNKKSGENIHAFSNRRQLLPAPERASWVAHPIGMVSLSMFSVSSQSLIGEPKGKTCSVFSVSVFRKPYIAEIDENVKPYFCSVDAFRERRKVFRRSDHRVNSRLIHTIPR